MVCRVFRSYAPIPDATSDWTKSWFFYLHYIREISKVVYKKSLSCNTQAELDTIQCDLHALVRNTCTGFILHTPDFADFTDVQVKKSRFRPVVAGVSLQWRLPLFYWLSCFSTSRGSPSYQTATHPCPSTLDVTLMLRFFLRWKEVLWNDLL